MNSAQHPSEIYNNLISQSDFVVLVLLLCHFNYIVLYCSYIVFKSTSENTPSNKTLAHAKSVKMSIWEIGTLNQLFIKGSSIKCSKKWIS